MTESPSSDSSCGSSTTADSVPNESTALCVSWRARAWRQYSVSSAGSFVSRPRSPSVSRIVHEVAHRHALAEQQLQHAVHLADAAHVGHELVDDGREALAQVVEQGARVLAREQLGRVLADGLGQVRDRRPTAWSTTV